MNKLIIMGDQYVINKEAFLVSEEDNSSERIGTVANGDNALGLAMHYNCNRIEVKNNQVFSRILRQRKAQNYSENEIEIVDI